MNVKLGGSGAKGQPTSYTKLERTKNMYKRGCSFALAAHHLKKEGGDKFVVLHLICQSIELILKSFLLYKDYDKYISKMKKINHDLEKAVKKVITEFGVGNKMSPSTADELKSLNFYYMNHILRYGIKYDLLIDPETIPIDNVLKKLNSTIRLANRSFPWE